ncbi:MarR family winged helix-turn-helix transcriptional regulator [Dermacoccaceae bacterium W4C1]
MTTWLTGEQQRVWRQWVQAGARLNTELNRQLQRGPGLSLQDYTVLVALTDAVDGRARMSDVADFLQWDRSRLSHHIGRMVSRDLVERQSCAEDGRGAYLAITPHGREVIAEAAPTHVDGVRELLFGEMTAEEMAVLDRVTRRVVTRLDDLDAADGVGGAGAA